MKKRILFLSLMVLMSRGLYAMESDADSSVYTPMEKVIEYIENFDPSEEQKEDTYADELKTLLADVALSERDSVTGNSLLTIAAVVGNNRAVDILATLDKLQQEKGEEKAFDYENSLHETILVGDDVDTVKALIAQGADIAQSNILYNVILRERKKVFEFLLVHIATRPDKDEILEMEDEEQGETAVLCAASFEQWDFLRALKAVGARLDVVDDAGMSVVDYVELSGNVILMSEFGFQSGAYEFDVDMISSDEEM